MVDEQWATMRKTKNEKSLACRIRSEIENYRALVRRLA